MSDRKQVVVTVRLSLDVDAHTTPEQAKGAFLDALCDSGWCKVPFAIVELPDGSADEMFLCQDATTSGVPE